MPDEKSDLPREYQDILDRLRGLEPSRVPAIPLIDPTANVLKLVEKAVERMDDLRATDDRWSERLRRNEERYGQVLESLREKLAIAESDRINAVNLAESRRIDATISEMKSAVALASEKDAERAAALAQSVVAATQTATTARESLNASLEPRITRLEQQQYQTGGRDIQRGEEQGQSNVNRGLVITLILAAVGWGFAILSFVLKR